MCIYIFKITIAGLYGRILENIRYPGNHLIICINIIRIQYANNIAGCLSYAFIHRIVDPAVERMQVDGNAGGFPDRADAHDVVHVGVRQPDRPEMPGASIELGEKHRGLFTRIDDDRLPGAAVGHEIAVFGELPVGKRYHLQLRHRPAPPPRPSAGP